MFKAIFGKRNSQAENNVLPPVQSKTDGLTREYLDRQNLFLSSIGRHMRFGIDRAINCGSADYSFSAIWDKQLDVMTPVERGQLFADLVHWNVFRTHEAAKDVLFVQKHPEALPLSQLTIHLPDRLYDGSEKTIFKEEIVFMEFQAKEIIYNFVTDAKRDKPFYGQSPTRHVMSALVTALSSFDHVLATEIRNAGYGMNWAKPLLKKICQFESAFTINGEKDCSEEERDVSSALSELLACMQRLPGRWIIVPAEPNIHWPNLNHQLFPLRSEINRYLNAVEKALIFGRKVEPEKVRALALLEVARGNLKSIKSGLGSLRPFCAIEELFPPGEIVSLKNPYWSGDLPDHENIIDRLGNPNESLIVDIEEKYISEIEQKIRTIANIAQKPAFMEKLISITPHEIGTKPAKNWVRKAEELFTDGDLDDTLKAIEAIEPMNLNDVFSCEPSKMSDALMELDVRTRDETITLWAGHLAGERAIEPLMKAARKCYKKQPGVGPKKAKLGNAAATSLSLIAGGLGVPALMQLEREVKYPQIKRHLEKCIAHAAAQAGQAKQAMIEETVVDHGFS